ncbi:MAG: aspartate kinase [Bacillota bacterium]|nr:aspartate kinase [Bacillota bacterium]
MGLIVQKFEESLISDTIETKNLVDKVKSAYIAGNSVVVVAAVQGNYMEELVNKANRENPSRSKRELDVLISAYGQIIASLTTMAIESSGIPAISLTGYQAGIISDSNYSNARIKSIDNERIFRELDRKNVVVIAASQAWNKFEDITTFGKGGDDTTAVAVAASLQADICEFYTDLDGVYTADPKIVSSAVKLKDISYDELLELSSLGANILHNRAVELAKKYNVNLVIKSRSKNIDGTIVKEVGSVEKLMVRGVTRDNEIARIAVMGIEDKPGMAFKLFSALAKENINVDLIIQSIGRDGTEDISFTVGKSNLEGTLEVINKNMALLNPREVQHSDKYSKVSIVGAGMVNNPGIAAKMFEALYEAGINIHMITTSETKISVLVDVQDSEMAVNVIHEKFNLNA